MIRVLIIEDEQPAAKRLQREVLALRPNAHIICVIDSIEEAIEFFNAKHEVDIVFMDIQLADGISFEIFNKCHVNAPVIFTTAYDHYAVKAFRVNSIDYLLKPVDENELSSALQKFEALQKADEQHNYAELIHAIREQKETYKQRFLVKTAGRLTFVNTTDVAYFFSDEGNTFLVTHKNDRFLLEQTLEEIEMLLNPADHFRINRKMIVALNSIQRIKPHSNSRYQLELVPVFEEEVIVSRQRGAEFKNWLDH